MLRSNGRLGALGVIRALLQRLWPDLLGADHLLVQLLQGPSATV